MVLIFWFIFFGCIFQDHFAQSFPCGVGPILNKKNVTRTKRIVGGQISQIHSWPWLVNFIDIKDSLQYCSGSIINPYWILTAAHCFSFSGDSGERISLPLSSYAYHNADHLLNSTGIHEYTVEATQLYLHPQYKIATKKHPGKNDIALIKLKWPLNFTDYVQPICLPDVNINLPVGYGCHLAGWGNIVDKEGYYRSTILKEIKVNLVSFDECNSKQSFNGVIPNSFFCAGFPQGGIDGCYGDSGAPLQCSYNGVYSVIGTMSWGIGCAKPRYYGVYTNVTYLLPFIESILKGPNQHLTTYYNTRRKKCHLITRKMYDLFTNESYFDEIDLVRTFQILPHQIMLSKQITLVDFCQVANALNYTTNIATVGSILKTYFKLVDKLEIYNQFKMLAKELNIRLFDVINLSKLSLKQLLSSKNNTQVVINNIKKAYTSSPKTSTSIKTGKCN